MSSLYPPRHREWYEDFRECDVYHREYILVEWDLWGPTEEELEKLKKKPGDPDSEQESDSARKVVECKVKK